MTFALALAAAAIVWVTLAPAALAVHAVTKSLLASVEPRTRAALLLALALLPVAVAALVTVLGFAPAIGGWVVDQHCHPGTGCATHVPVWHADPWYAVLLAISVAVASVSLIWSVAGRLRRSLALATSLHFLAERDEQRPCEVIDSGERFAYCIGLLRPKVMLSRGLIESLSPRQLEVVLRHEETHAARRDNLRHWVAALALLPMPHRLKQPLFADLALAAEHACDGAAANVGGPGLVSETLAALSIDARAATQRAAATFGGATIENRIRALRTEHWPRPPAAAVHAAIALAYAVCAIIATDAAHHGTELLVALFA